jgi:hypothetical protein
MSGAVSRREMSGAAKRARGEEVENSEMTKGFLA